MGASHPELRTAAKGDWPGRDSVLGRLLAGLRALDLPAFHRPVVRKAVFGVAAAGFAIGIGLSLRAYPDVLDGLAWEAIWPVIAFGVPASLFLAALEFMLVARLIGVSSSLGKAAEIVVIGAAANLLPVPGGAVVRVAALKSGGGSVGAGTTVILFLALLWLAMALAYAGAWMMVATPGPVGPAGLAAGLLIMAGLLAGAVRLGAKWPILWPLLAVKLMLLVLDAARLWLCFAAIGVPVGFAETSVLTLSAVVGSAVTVVPSGLGVREVLAAAIAPALGLAAASGFLAIALNRVLELLAMAPVAMLLAWRWRSSSQNRSNKDVS